jgi:hypothetical protein
MVDYTIAGPVGGRRIAPNREGAYTAAADWSKIVMSDQSDVPDNMLGNSDVPDNKLGNSDVPDNKLANSDVPDNDPHPDDWKRNPWRPS